MMDLVVAVTLGQRDLQVLAVRDGEVFSVSPQGRQVRAFHQWLVDHEGAYDIVGPDELKVDVREEERFGMSGDGVRLPAEFRLAANSEIGRSKPDDARPLVYPKLLSSALDVLKRESAVRRVALRRLILLYTHRDEHSRWAGGEFIATQPLRKWLQRWLPVQDPEVVAPPIAFLQGQEELYVQDQAGNQHLLPEAALRIDRAIEAASRLASSDQATIRLHDSAGIPQASPVLQASARLHFADRVQYRAPTEGDDAAPNPAALAPVLPAVAVLEARRRACDLVQRGEFQAAAELARPFPMEGPQWGWNLCLAAVAAYFQGYLADAAERAEQLGSGPTGQALRNILHPQRPMSLHVAQRAEAALAASDALNAASLTVTFLDVAEYDAINRTLSKTQSEPCMDRASRKIVRSRFKPDEMQLRRAIQEVPGMASWIRPPEARDVEKWLRRNTFHAKAPWQECAIFSLIRSAGSEPALARALLELLEALHRATNTGNVPAEFRNITMHSVMADREIQLMAQLFESRSLWRRRKGGPASCLHPDARPATVLAALGVRDAQQMHADLVQGLVADLRTCRLA